MSESELFGDLKAEVKAVLGEGRSDFEVEEALKQAKIIAKDELTALYMIQDRICEKCGECCREPAAISLTEEELERASKYLGNEKDRLMEKYRINQVGDGKYEVKGRPCGFLNGNLCTIYPVRPYMCRRFPALAILATLNSSIVDVPAYCKIIRKWMVARALVILGAP